MFLLLPGFLTGVAEFQTFLPIPICQCSTGKLRHIKYSPETREHEGDLERVLLLNVFKTGKFQRQNAYMSSDISSLWFSF